ncbi:ArsR family transcriptional regulator [Kitasatospora sp. NPDC004669]|uniref:ArsR/SmtB family transcription factor n=1 Tax=Kitasatospora sp. NPDC004669 TaxID=3154555 RepID=UPI0033A284FC
MSEVRFEPDDVAGVRFAVSPLWETVASLWALAEPARHAVHLPWIRAARLLTRDRELARRTAPLRSLVRSGTCLPDFLTPPPDVSLGEIEAELAVVRSTPACRVRAEVGATDCCTSASPFARLLTADPERSLPLLVEAVRGWWEVAIEPHWPLMRALLEADISHRTRQFADGGVRLLFENLHPTLRWTGDRLVADDRLDTGVTLGGRGPPLLPSVFAGSGLLLATHPTSPPIAVYPARAVGTLWEQQPSGDAGVVRLLGRNRTQVLEYTSSPSTITQLAARTGLSLGAVSQHLAVLRAAGLVTSRRYRREVNYTVSDLGTALLDGARAPRP